MEDKIGHYDLIWNFGNPAASRSGDGFPFEDAGAARQFQSIYRLEGRPASGGAEALTAPWAVRETN